MSPSTTKLVSEGQGEKFYESWMTAIRKSGLPHKQTQEVLEQEGKDLADSFVADVRRRVERRLRSWYEKDRVIYFSVTSDGTTGEQWIAKIEVGGKRVGNYAKQLLRSEKFKPTSGVTYNVAVFKGEIFSDNNRYTSNIRTEAKRRKFTTPPAELACLIRQKFSDADIEAMGLTWIVTFHGPIEDSDGSPDLLGMNRNDDCTIDAYWGSPDDRWNREDGLAFLVP